VVDRAALREGRVTIQRARGGKVYTTTARDEDTLSEAEAAAKRAADAGEAADAAGGASSANTHDVVAVSTAFAAERYGHNRYGHYALYSLCTALIHNRYGHKAKVSEEEAGAEQLQFESDERREKAHLRYVR
jgi:hypothetical protein